MRTNAFTPGEFLERLREDKLTPPLVISGMVKPTAESKTFSFSVGGCNAWVELPVEAIENAAILGTLPCENQSASFGADRTQATDLG